MKKVTKNILIGMAVLITTGYILFSSLLIIRNHDLEKKVDAITTQKEKVEIQLEQCGQEKNKLEENTKALTEEVTTQKEEIENLKTENDKLKK